MSRKKKEPETLDDLIDEIVSNPEDFIAPTVDPNVMQAEMQAQIQKIKEAAAATASKSSVPEDLKSKMFSADDILRILLTTNGGITGGLIELMWMAGSSNDSFDLSAIKRNYQVNTTVHNDLLNLFRAVPKFAIAAGTLKVVKRKKG